MRPLFYSKDLNLLVYLQKRTLVHRKKLLYGMVLL
jgi:hypothetical protein